MMEMILAQTGCQLKTPQLNITAEAELIGMTILWPRPVRDDTSQREIEFILNTEEKNKHESHFRILIKVKNNEGV